MEDAVYWISANRWLIDNMRTSRPKYTIKQILLSDQNWWQFYEKYNDKIRPAIVICVVKLLSCRTKIRGYHKYHCTNPACSHVKHVCHTCKCKLCSSCGKKATEAWIAKQNNILPKTSWQHITFTMPQELWDFFWYNRALLNLIGAIAATCIKTIADQKRLIPGVFIAIHTFGRDLKRNVHIHLSVTNGGISEDNTQWKKLFFDQTTLMRMWRYHIIALFRAKQAELIIPTALQQQLNHTLTFNQFLNQLYRKDWIVHCSKPSDDPKFNVNYLARYVKRPAIAQSKLKHYDGNEIVFKYLDHTTKTYRKLTLTVENFIKRLIRHIPDKNFRMIRYYGFLSHRLRGKLLPIVYQLLNQAIIIPLDSPTFSELMQRDFRFDPLQCILCGARMILVATHFGITAMASLLDNHQQLALLKKI